MITTMTTRSDQSPPQNGGRDDRRSVPIGPAGAATTGARQDGFVDDSFDRTIHATASERGGQPGTEDQRMHDDPADRSVAIR